MTLSSLRKMLTTAFYFFLFKTFYFIKNRQKRKIFVRRNLINILVYPYCKDDVRLRLLIKKLIVAIPDSKSATIHLLTDQKLFDQAISDVLASLKNYMPNIEIPVFQIINRKTNFSLKDFDLVLCTKTMSLFKLIFWFYKTEVIDQNFYSYIEGVNLQRLYHKICSQDELDHASTLSKTNFMRLAAKFSSCDSAYCLLTGPSIKNYGKINFRGNSIKIICNSNVRNSKLLDHINGPDVITFADPIFHFGANDYSLLFRKTVMEIVMQYNSYVLVPLFNVPLLLSWFPSLRNNIIGLETLPGSFNLSKPDSMWVKATDNIFTMLMLPFALTFADTVYIAGADGRENNEKYFWKFGSDSQFTTEMESVFISHPSFFRDRNFKSYYKNHCKLVEQLIGYAEGFGKNIYSLTPSYIPALNDRYKNYTMH
jgi:hypothetical protein